jgi:hypothetical protein
MTSLASGNGQPGSAAVLRVASRNIAPHKVDKLRSWMLEAQRRDDEVRETFRQEPSDTSTLIRERR